MLGEGETLLDVGAGEGWIGFGAFGRGAGKVSRVDTHENTRAKAQRCNCSVTIRFMGDTQQATEHWVGEREELRRRIEQLEADLGRYREEEQLLVRTLVSATSHATAIRESARRDAELILRKARAEAQRRTVAAERARGNAERELLRLRRITEQMRRGLSGFLTAKLGELQLETEQEMLTPEPTAELGAALEGALEGQMKSMATSESVPTADRDAETLDNEEHDLSGGSG